MKADLAFNDVRSDCELIACYGDIAAGSDTNGWTCVSQGIVPSTEASRTVSVTFPESAKFVRFCMATGAGIAWSRTFELETITQPVFTVEEFNAAGSTEASFTVEIDALGANAESVTATVKYGLMKDDFVNEKALGSLTEPGVISNVVSGLAFDTKYWYQVEVKNMKDGQVANVTGMMEVVRDWGYSVCDDGVAINHVPTDCSGTLVIPTIIDGMPVTAMEGGWHDYDGITHLIIPECISRMTVTGYEGFFLFNSNLVIDWYVSRSGVLIEGNVFSYYNNYCGYGKINVYAYGPYPNYFPKESVLKLWCTREVAKSWLDQVGYNVFQGYLDSDDPDDVRPLSVKVLFTAMRANDPTIMDVEYVVNSKKPKVKTRVLAYQDAVKSFAKVLRPETFTAETRAFVGDDVTANETHKVSWHVAADWGTDLSRVAFEVLAIEEDLLPLEVTTIPATANHASCTYSWNAMTADQVLAALYWLYADGDMGLTVENGYLKANGVTLASGNALSNQEKAIEYVYGKMGYQLLKGDDLTYVNKVTGLNLQPSGVRQYAIKYE